ncbi:MAG: transglycosylase domain-containing protein, partial [Treponema sp.]|nr:transglycosylase domain-containing protein [Treponema sp.]
MSKTMQKSVRIVCAVCLVFFTFILPLVKISLQVSHYSYALYDKNGVLLGASVAEDGQWRFSPIEVPEKFKKAIITFEDKRFYFHQGVDLIAVARSAILNIRSKKIVSGASTITMQLVRILEHNKKRTFLQKIKEAFLSLFFEIRYTK